MFGQMAVSPTLPPHMMLPPIHGADEVASPVCQYHWWPLVHFSAAPGTSCVPAQVAAPIAMMMSDDFVMADAEMSAIGYAIRCR